MDSERIVIPDKAVNIVNNAKDASQNVCAVGTTVLRTLESSVSTQGYLKPFDGWTNKFIFPHTNSVFLQAWFLIFTCRFRRCL
jgi:S-adenosylmethionine:tRNA ribosyltransferase-isomerase